MDGPVPLIKENLPISTGPEIVQVSRAPADDCFDYIIALIDEALPDLLLTHPDPPEDAGRLDKIVVVSMKAKILVYVASPLFNGIIDQAGLQNKDGTPQFTSCYVDEKWCWARTEGHREGKGRVKTVNTR